VLLLVLPSMLPPALWCWRNHEAVGQFTLSTIGGLNFYLGHNAAYADDPGAGNADYGAFDRLRQEAGLGEVEADRALYARGRTFIADHPWTAIANVARKTAAWLTPTTRSFGPIAYALVFGVLAWHAAAAAPGPDRRRRFIALLVACVVPALLVANNLLTRTPETGVASIAFVLASARDVLILGLPALFLGRFDRSARRLLQWLFLSQWLVAIAFIPLSRIRWPVDPLLIIALAATVEHIGRSFASPETEDASPA
jgi:hypothetical protein